MRKLCLNLESDSEVRERKHTLRERCRTSDICSKTWGISSVYIHTMPKLQTIVRQWIHRNAEFTPYSTKVSNANRIASSRGGRIPCTIPRIGLSANLESTKTDQGNTRRLTFTDPGKPWVGLTQPTLTTPGSNKSNRKPPCDDQPQHQIPKKDITRNTSRVLCHRDCPRQCHWVGFYLSVIHS